MAQKVYSRSSKRQKIYQFDDIPDHQKQQRSPASKRKRTDFSFFSSSSDENKGGGNEFAELIQCHSSAEERLRPLSDFYGVSVAEVESSCRNGTNCRNSDQGSKVAISECENCFEERSSNSAEDFQDALKQALKREEDLGSPAEFQQTPDESIHSGQQDQSKDQYAPSSSSMAEDDFPKPRRGTRERRHNARFDKIVFQRNPTRNIRRFKIMRNLGLIPPVGSPF